LRRMLERELLTEFLVQNFKIQDRDYRIDPATRYLRVKNAGRLDRTAQVYLKHFFAAREAQARKLNWPPHNVLANETLIEVARRPPNDPSRWKELVRRRGRPIELEGFVQARQAADRELRDAPAPREQEEPGVPSSPAGSRGPKGGRRPGGRRRSGKSGRRGVNGSKGEGGRL